MKVGARIPSVLRAFVVAALFAPVFAAFLFASTPAAAQVNIERHRTDTDGTQVAFDLSLAIRSGNSELYDASAGASVSHRNNANLVLAIARVRYGEKDGSPFASSAFAHVRLTRWFGKAIGGELFAQLENDRFTLLQLRSLVGGGFRVRIADSEAIAAFVGSSVMLEIENLDADKVEVHPASSEVVRWSSYLSLQWDLTSNASFSSTAYVQPQVNDFGDVRLLHDAALDVALTNVVSVRVAFRQRFDNRPPDGVARHDIFLENGIRIRI